MLQQPFEVIIMPSKLQNRMKRIMYKPAKKKSTHLDFLTQSIEDAEKALDSTIGGIFGNKRKRKRKK